MLVSSRFTILAAAAAATLSLTGLGAVTASATVIYSDSFTKTATALNGQTVASSTTYAGGTAGATWVANTCTENGSIVDMTNSGSEAYLPFAPQSGYMYTLSAVLSGGSSDWATVGFSSSDSFGYFRDNAYSWGLVRGSGLGAPQFFQGLGTSGGNTFGTTSDAGTQTMTITLNTTGVHWTSYATILSSGDTSPLVTYSSPPSITYVGFGNNTVGTLFATAASFSLSATTPSIPEPATLGLMGVGSLGILLSGRRRRA